MNDENISIEDIIVEENNTYKTPTRKPYKFLKRLLINVSIILGIILLFNIFIFNATIPTTSMYSTISPDDRVLGLKSAYWFDDIHRGDIVILNSIEEKKYLVKRIVGLPGDVVNIKDGYVYINDIKLSEKYTLTQGKTEKGNINKPTKVPDNCYFLLGDNRENSYDSRYWSEPFISKKAILAKVVFRYYPFDEIGILK